MKNTSKFQNVVIVTIVGWLVLFVFLPNLMIIGTSFLTRDDASFVKMVFTLDNYARLLDPLYFEVLLHSLNMALIATLSCLVLGYPFAWFLAKLPEKIRPLLLFLLIVPFWTNSLIRIYGLKIFLSTKGYLNEFLLWLGVIDTPIRIMFTRAPLLSAWFTFCCRLWSCRSTPALRSSTNRYWRPHAISAPVKCKRSSASLFH